MKILPVAHWGNSQVSSIIAPNQISGLIGWWKASALGLSDNDPVTSWVDSSNNGLTVVQATGASQPTFKATLAPNNKPCVSFDGADFLRKTSINGTSLFASNECHIFIVQYQAGADAANTTFNFFNAVAQQVNAHLTFGDVLYWDFGDKAASGTNGRVNANQPIGWDDSWRLVQLIRKTDNTQSIRVGGSELVSASRLKTFDRTLSYDLNIGAGDGSTGTNHLTGYIAEMFMFSAALTDNQRLSMETYINNLYTLF